MKNNSDIVCDFSGEVIPQKNNSAQKDCIKILPKYRKQFKNCIAHLLIIDVLPVLYKDNQVHVIKHTPVGYLSPSNGNHIKTDLHTFLSHEKKNGWIFSKQYKYALVVTDSDLEGCVEGYYENVSFRINSTRRRIARLIGYRPVEVWACGSLNNRKSLIAEMSAYGSAYKKLLSFHNEIEGWDGHGGKPCSYSTYQNALSFLKNAKRLGLEEPNLAMGNDGSVGVSWNKNGWHIAADFSNGDSYVFVCMNEKENLFTGDSLSSEINDQLFDSIVKATTCQ